MLSFRNGITLHPVRVCKVFGKVCPPLIVGAGPGARPLCGYIWHDRAQGPRPTIQRGLCQKLYTPHVSRLRRKLGNLGTQIETVYGVGYRLKEKK